MDFRRIGKENFFSALGNESRAWQKNYLAMYSSQWGGITTDPDLMLIPIDDHVVHRGDGVFDVIRCVCGNIYQMEQHLERLERSAKAISLRFPDAYENVRELINRVVAVGGERDCLIRLMLSRGPGSFSINPNDCLSSQLYVNVIRYHSLPEKSYREGVSVVTSQIPIKKSFFATIKSCNYLPNVLMKIEALKAGCEYSIAHDEHGFLAEGSTENVGVVTPDGTLRFPEFDRTLSGVTAKRVFQLAENLVKEKMLEDVKFARISPEEAYGAEEMFLTGTSLNVLPVVRFDGRQIGKGIPGPVYAGLSALLWEDMTRNQELLTPIEWDSKA